MKSSLKTQTSDVIDSRWSSSEGEGLTVALVLWSSWSPNVDALPSVRASSPHANTASLSLSLSLCLSLSLALSRSLSLSLGALSLSLSLSLCVTPP